MNHTRDDWTNTCVDLLSRSLAAMSLNAKKASHHVRSLLSRRPVLYLLGEPLRSSRAGAGTAPRKANTDIEYVIAIIGFIIDALELIPKPFVPVTNIDKSLFMNEEFDT